VVHCATLRLELLKALEDQMDAFKRQAGAAVLQAKCDPTVTAGLVDAICAIASALTAQNLRADEARAALADLATDPHVRAVMSAAEDVAGVSRN
jgi:hypothetical protein